MANPMKQTAALSSQHHQPTPGRSDRAPGAGISVGTCAVPQPAERGPVTNLVLRSPWAVALSDELRKRVAAELCVKQIPSGGYVCRKGDQAEHWFGILEGLVKVSTVSREGKAVSFIGVPAGGWFGEGAVLKNEKRPYDAVALRPSTVAYVPRGAFMLLVETSVYFNRFLLALLNERLGQFIAMVEHGRLLAPDARVATELVSLLNPLLYPGNQVSIPICQEELAHLMGLSRSVVNKVLKRLHREGIVKVGYGTIAVLDRTRLRDWGQESVV